MSPVASFLTTYRCSNVSMCLRISTKCLLYSVGNETYYYYLLDSWYHLYIYFHNIIHSAAYRHMWITWLSYFGSENQGSPLRSWFMACWLWRRIPIVTSLTVPSSCVVTQTPIGTNSVTRRRKRKFLLLFIKLWSWYNRNWPFIWSVLSWLVLLSSVALVVPAVSRPLATPAQTVSWSIPITTFCLNQYWPRYLCCMVPLGNDELRPATKTSHALH